MLDFQDNVLTQYDPTEVFNTDQSGFNYIVHTNRTLSYTGERITTATVESLNALTHSYTVQPLLNMNGNLVGKLYINLKETKNQFGPIVAQNMPNYENLYVTCTTSGKLDKGLIVKWKNEVFKDVVNNLHSGRCVIYVDSWGGHRDADLYQIEGKDVSVKIFPKTSTKFMQPLDLYCNRQWKDVAKRLEEHAMLCGFRLDQRNDILKMQSLIYNQFQHPTFRPLWLCAWRLAGFEVPEIPFEPMSKILFEFNEDCSTLNCSNMPFIKCVHCSKVLCFICFFINYLYHS